MRWFLRVLPVVAASACGGAVVPLGPGQVRMEGALGLRHERNIRYLLHLHEQRGAMMIEAFSQRGRRTPERPWDGEYAGKWLDAAALAVASRKRPELAPVVGQFARRLAAAQEPDGYMGIEPASGRGRSPWDIWNHGYAIGGFLACAEYLRIPELLGPARKAGAWIVERCGPVPGPDNQRFFRGAWGGGCNVAMLGQLSELLAHTHGEPRLHRFIEAAARHYPPFAEMRRTREPQLSHAYVVCAGLGGLVEFSRTTANPEDLPWIQEVWAVLRDRHLLPTGSLGVNERLVSDPSSDVPDARLQETCATVEWLLLSHRLYCATGDAQYVDAIERTVFNALPAAQALDGMHWTYFTPFRYLKRHFEGPTRCCYWSGPRGISRLPTFMYCEDPEGIRIDLYESAGASATRAGIPITIRQRSDPALGRVSVGLDMPSSRTFTLRLRLAAWMQQPVLQLNGRAVVPDIAGGYIVINREWRSGDDIELRFGPALQVHLLGDGSRLAQFGPWILAVDEADNPSLDLDQVRLPASFNPMPLGRDPAGRQRFSAELPVGSGLERVTLVTYADAGQPGSRFRTAFPAAP